MSETFPPPQEMQPGLSPGLRDFIAGGLGGMCGVLAGQPLDTIRIRLQSQACRHTSISGVWRAMLGSGEGVRGLFKGASYPLMTTALQNAITFQAQGAAYRALRSLQQQEPKPGALPAPSGAVTAASRGAEAVPDTMAAAAPASAGTVCSTAAAAAATPAAASALERAQSNAEASACPGPSHVPWTTTCLAGMFAGAVQTTISSPVELLKIRLQLHKAPGYISALGMLRRLVAVDGVRGLTRGFGITLLRDTPSYGLYFVAYEFMVEGLQAALQLPPLGLQAGSSCHTAQFLAGGLAGMVAWLSVYPVDVVKTRMQASPAGGGPRLGALQCAVDSYRQEGLQVFTKGLGATMARAFITNAAIFATFELCMNVLP